MDEKARRGQLEKIVNDEAEGVVYSRVVTPDELEGCEGSLRRG